MWRSDVRLHLVVHSVWVKKGATLLLEAGAGVHSGYSDKEYKDVGVTVIDDVNDALSTADMLVAVNKPPMHS